MKIRNYTNLKVSEMEGKGMILGRGWRVRETKMTRKVNFTEKSCTFQ